MNTEKKLLEIANNAETNLLFSDIEILDYYIVYGNIECLKVNFAFTTTGNIITFSKKINDDNILVLHHSCYSVKNPKMFYEPIIDYNTVNELYKVARLENKVKKRIKSN